MEGRDPLARAAPAALSVATGVEVHRAARSSGYTGWQPRLRAAAVSATQPRGAHQVAVKSTMTGSSAERAIAAAHSSSECTPTTEPSCARSAAMSVARAPAAAGAFAAAGGLRALAFQPTRSHSCTCRASRYGCTTELTCAAHAASRFCVLGGSLQAERRARESMHAPAGA
eukprot:scaffold55143_cov55-Phaeocystis_antarctica.AAC.1